MCIRDGCCSLSESGAQAEGAHVLERCIGWKLGGLLRKTAVSLYAVSYTHLDVYKRQEDIRLIDLIIELVDARMPLGSRNPDIDSLGRQKARLVLLNKADLADPAVNREWISWFEGQGVKALEINAPSAINCDACSLQ